MKKWCRLTDEVVVDPGNFTEARLVSLSGRPLHEEVGFVEALADEFMARYEGQPTGSLLEYEDAAVIEQPERTHEFYRHVLDADGNPLDDFQVWATESLATWMEEEFEAPLLVDCNRPHTNDPVYDVITLVSDTRGVPRLRLVQVKSTELNLQRECNVALDGFRTLESGKYYPHLWNRLRLLRRHPGWPKERTVRDLFYDPSKCYRVTAVHSADRDAMDIMTTYSQKVDGDLARRSARLVHIANWTEMWRTLAGAVNQRLN